MLINQFKSTKACDSTIISASVLQMACQRCWEQISRVQL